MHREALCLQLALGQLGHKALEVKAWGIPQWGQVQGGGHLVGGLIDTMGHYSLGVGVLGGGGILPNSPHNGCMLALHGHILLSRGNTLSQLHFTLL